MAYPSNPWQDHDKVALLDPNERAAFEKMLVDFFAEKFSAADVKNALAYVEALEKTRRGRAYLCLKVSQTLYDPPVKAVVT